MHATDLAPSNATVTPALLTLRQAADYLGVSYWTVRDYCLNGTLSVVRLPAARVDAGKRRGKAGELPPDRVLVRPDDERVAGRSLRRMLIRREELDRLILSHTERMRPYDGP